MSDPRAAVEAQLLAWMREADFAPDAERFEALALALFRVQFARCAPYARLCEARGATPERVRSWRDVPAVPAGAFKEVALRGFPAAASCKVFRTSGSSGTRRGELHLDTLRLYEASVGPPFDRFVLPELEGRPGRARLLVLAPAPGEVPDSSLSHMFGVLLGRRGDPASGFFVRGGALDAPVLVAALEACGDTDAPVALCGTAFAFVHLLDALRAAGRRLRLPPSARVMETGGFKGRVRERPRGELLAEIEERLGVPPERVVDQYGMTELASQFHDSVLRHPGEARRKLGPPWARVRLVDPATGADCVPGDVGLVQVHDLANTGSVAAILTADLGRAVGDGFEVLRRAPDAEARGCSIGADEMLGASG
jgi:hypothetical protein